MEVHGENGGLPKGASPKLKALLPRLALTIAHFKAKSTMGRYTFSWRRWRKWAKENGLRPIPATPLAVALYLTETTAAARTFSVVRLASAAVAAFHHAVGLPSPTETEMVYSVREAAKRLLPDGKGKKGECPGGSQPPLPAKAGGRGQLAHAKLGRAGLSASALHPAEPLELRHVVEICERFAGEGCSLEDLMACTAISLAFFGFLRYADLTVMVADEMEVTEDYADLFLGERAAANGSTAINTAWARRVG